MLKGDLKKLIFSLSGTERKYFKRNSQSNGLDKGYLNLFNLMCKEENTELNDDIENLFKKQYPKKSFDNTAAYLYKVITDMLVRMRIDHDKWFYSQHCLMKAKLCFERSLPERGLQELAKIKSLAKEGEDNLMYYAASRMELTTIAENGFQFIKEQDLIDLQMKAKHSLQTIRQTHEHHSLFELLTYRLRSKNNDADQFDQKLNDLILSELSITTRGGHQPFESKKLHLLFQAFFLSHIGDRSSALKIFKNLNILFEQHPQLWSWPPYDYLSALDGILDSLRSIGYYDEMDFFIDKLQLLANGNYPDHFIKTLIQLLVRYQLNALIGKKLHQSALNLIEKNKIFLNKKKYSLNREKELELLFFISLSYFLNKDFQKANQYIALGILQEKQGSKHIIYRVSRLLRMAIHFEMQNFEYLQYEIRTHKRLFSRAKSFLLERLLFNILLANPKKSSFAKTRLTWLKQHGLIEKIKTSADEKELLKYFDFLGWMDSLKEVRKN